MHASVFDILRMLYFVRLKDKHNVYKIMSLQLYFCLQSN